jgi:hypothetical protein
MKTPTKFIKPLTPKQREELCDLMKTANEPVRKRAHAVLLNSRGYSVDEIADIYEADRDSVSNWLDRWENDGANGLPDKEGRGRKPILNEKEQKQAIKMENKRRMAMLMIIVANSIFMTYALFFQPAQDQLYTIRGRVIDADRNPVKNALIYYTQEIGEYVGDTLEGVKSDALGKFSLPVNEYVKSKPLRLFVTSDIPAKTMALMYPPFSSNPDNVRAKFAGPRVVLNTQKEIFIGDVVVKAIFLPVVLAVLDQKGDPRLVTPAQWSDVVVRLLDHNGNPIASSGMSQRDFNEAVNMTKSEIRVAIPEGDWQVEVSVTDFDGPFFGAPVSVSKSASEPQRAIIKVANSKQ